ncbi:hypothetical protein L3X38_006236 [Prunus dulcis]|uniref:Uncharacterized protein n=1 Tax=Prunus dulcis TaxID=3755 RepID=A0AAD5F4Z6_PRUDU|nr:hypothetical protein L3X38_006236 [Prunus dulcis]
MMKSIGEGQVPVELAGNVINEEGNEEEESAEEDTNIDARRRRLEFENSADESDKEIYESGNDATLDDNNEFDVDLQSNFGRGFLAGCRPIIGVDGCHLKGHFSCQLLAAIGVDANDNTNPIAYAGLDKAFDIMVPQAQHKWKSSSHATLQQGVSSSVNLSASTYVNPSTFASVNPFLSVHPTPRQGPRLLGVSSSAPWKPPGKAPRK